MSLWAALHALHHQHQAKRDLDVDGIGAVSGLVEFCRDVAPSILLAKVSRHMFFDQCAHIAKRAKLHDLGDRQRMQERP